MPVVRVLDVDPELSRGLEAAALETLRSEAVARLWRVARGPWAAGDGVSAAQAPPGHLGFLVLDGLLARDVLIGSSVSTELVGPGDVLRPWSGAAPEALVRFHVRWCALEPAALAELDGAFAAVAGRSPALLSALMARAEEHALRLAVGQAICQLTGVHARLLLLLWQLAERWGRVGHQGVVLPLRLSHRTLGQLVGATRPSVSAALKALQDRGAVGRRADGAWLLAGDGPPAELCPSTDDAGWLPPSLVGRAASPPLAV